MPAASPTVQQADYGLKFTGNECSKNETKSREGKAGYRLKQN
jgi:hypothetical protein